MAKKLTLVKQSKAIGGVCTGLAKYFDIDVVIPRLTFLVISAAGGSGILLYFIFWLAMPNEGE